MRDQQKIEARIRHLGQNVFSRLSSLYSASRTQSQHLLQEGGGVSILEWRVLWDLSETGPLAIRDLARIQRADHSLLSRALPLMVRKGLVVTKRDPGDGRQTIIDLTPEGRAAYAQAAPIMARRRAALREVFSEEELHAFIGYMDRLETFMRQPLTKSPTEEPAE